MLNMKSCGMLLLWLQFFFKISSPHLLIHKSGKIAYLEDKLKWADFVTGVTNHKTQYSTAKFAIFFQHFFIKTLQALVGMLRDVNKVYCVTLIKADIIMPKQKTLVSIFSICILKTKIYDTHNLLLGISPSKAYSIMIDQENFQQRPKRTNCKNLCKVIHNF